jgi:thiosulfate/3-mercaptopyruvate sulfurtransferase
MTHRFARLTTTLALLLWLSACERLIEPTALDGDAAPQFNAESAPPITAPAQSPAFSRSLAVPPVALRPQLLVSTDWLVDNLDRPNVVVLHFGTLANYNAGHIPGARFVNLSALQPTRNGVSSMLLEDDQLRAAIQAAGVSTSDHVIVYGGVITAAARGFFILDYLGHPRVSLLDGGIAAWRANGLPVSTQMETPPPGSMVTPTRSDRLVTADWVHAALWNEDVTLLDVRPFAAYEGTANPSPNPPRNGHIPGAHSVFWQQFIVSTANPVLKDPETLRQLVAGTGATMNSTVVTYCFSGMLSSVAYFVVRYLGYDARLYDGSMLEWSPRLDLPIATCATPWC